MAITNDKLQWLRDINVLMTPITHTNWNTNADTATPYRATRRSSGAQNDSISFDKIIPQGTWTFELIHNIGTTRGIYSVQFDGVEQGTIDGYSGSAVNGVRSQITGLVVNSVGKVRISLVMATKNASSSSYVGEISHIQLRRTA